MKRIFEIIKKYWISLWLIAAALSLFAISTYAIYTRVTIAKRVVSTQAGIGSLFSSDHMSVGGTSTVEPFVNNTQDASVAVNVFNYVFPKEAVYRNVETEYELKATLGVFNLSNVFMPLSDPAAIEELRELNLHYSITYNRDNEVHNFADGITHTFTGCVIPGGAANADLFTLVFDKSELGDTPREYCIEIEATPVDTDLPKLTGYVKVRFSKQAASGWHGEVEELNSLKIDDYDGYNYYLEGNGTGYLTFRWNPTYVTINEHFLNNKENELYKKNENDDWVKLSPPLSESDLPQSGGMVSVTIKVDSENKTNRYEVQFFKVDPNESYTKEAVEGYLPNTNSDDWNPIEAPSGN